MSAIWSSMTALGSRDEGWWVMIDEVQYISLMEFVHLLHGRSSPVLTTYILHNHSHWPHHPLRSWNPRSSDEWLWTWWASYGGREKPDQESLIGPSRLGTMATFWAICVVVKTWAAMELPVGLYMRLRCSRPTVVHGTLGMRPEERSTNVNSELTPPQRGPGSVAVTYNFREEGQKLIVSLDVTFDTTDFNPRKLTPL